MMKRKTTTLFIALILLFTAFSFGSLKNDIKITLLEKQLQKMSSEGLVLAFYIKIENFSSRPYFLSGYSYRFVINQTDFIRLETLLDNGIRIESKRSSTIVLPVKITYSYLFNEIPDVAGAESVPCYIMGRFNFSDGRRNRGYLPIAFSGQFPIFKDPVLELLPLNMNMITIAGADVEIRVKVKNNNGFEFPVDRIEYDLKFGGHPIHKGRFSENKNIAAHGEKIFALPILLNFYEVGRDVYGLLRQAAMNISFSGEVELKTIWGRIIRPFDVQKKVSIDRN